MDGASGASSSTSSTSAAANGATASDSASSSSSNGTAADVSTDTSSSSSVASSSGALSGASAGATLASRPTGADALSQARTPLSTLTAQPTQAEVLAQAPAPGSLPDVSNSVFGPQTPWAQGDASVVLAQMTGPTAVPAADVAATPSVADQVRELTSYSLTDWSVTQQDQQQVVQLLRTDPNLNGTLRDLSGDANFFGASSLTTVVNRVDDPAQRRDLIDVLARGSDAANADVVRKELSRLDSTVVSGPGGMAGVAVDENLFQVRFNAVRLGVPTSGPAFDRGPYADLIRSDPGAAFTGAGSTGVDPTSAPGVPLLDQLAMAGEKASGTDEQPGSTSARYDNPLGGLDTYLAGLSPADRTRQAELFLQQPVASPMSEVWGPAPPTRAQVIEVAARRYNLDPATVAGFLLAEQRDQSQLEDAKDYAAVVNANHNGSVGLGQIVISTARNKDLFADTVSPETMRQAGNPAVARMLSDDVVSIFGAARYIRQVADAGAGIPTSVLDQRTRDTAIENKRQELSELPYTAAQKQVLLDTYAASLPANGAGLVSATFPGFDPAQYTNNSASWPRGNLGALGSEYTSRAWDGGWSAWGSFVAQARDDVVRSGVFR